MYTEDGILRRESIHDPKVRPSYHDVLELIEFRRTTWGLSHMRSQSKGIAGERAASRDLGNLEYYEI